jgi:DNA-binding transcriptional LysR family regulator
MPKSEADGEIPFCWREHTRRVCSQEMELRHLRYFLAVAEGENVSRAALRLNVSQPPLSRQIKQLEEELGCALFERTAKALRLTSAGKVFMKEARDILRRVERAAEAARAEAASGPVRIGYAPSLASSLLPGILRRLGAAPTSRGAPQLHDLGTAEMLRRLRAGKLDLALVVHPGKAALGGLEFQELKRIPACVVLPRGHAAAKARQVPIAEVATEPVVAFTRAEYPEYHRWLAEVFRGARRPMVREQHDSAASVFAAVEAGRGIAFGGEGLGELCGRRVVVKRLAPPAPAIRVGAVYPTGSPWAKRVVTG